MLYSFRMSLLLNARQVMPSLSMQMRSLRERIKELQTSHAAQISMVVEKYQLLKQQIEDYHRKLEAVMVTEPETTVRAISLR